MRKTIIHIGLHKTATTFLQENVWPQLREYTYLTRPYTQHNHAFNQLQYADDTLYEKDLMIRELEQIPGNNLLISDESFSGKPIFFSYLNRTTIARRLKELFPDAEIILFLRDQKDIIRSYYSSYVRMPYGVKKLSKLFYKPLSDYSYSDYRRNQKECQMSTLYYNTNDYFVHLDGFKYACLVAFYAGLFEKCHVFLYEDLKNDLKGSLARLEAIFEERIVAKSSEPMNMSLNRMELEKRRRANKLCSFVQNKYLHRIIRAFVGFIPNFNAENPDVVVDRMVADYYADDNGLLKARLPSLNWGAYPDKYDTFPSVLPPPTTPNGLTPYLEKHPLALPVGCNSFSDKGEPPVSMW